MHSTARRPLLLLVLIATMRGASAAPVMPLSDEPLLPLPASLGADPVRAAIGKRMFHDVRLSPDQRTSCATCHNLQRGGADGQARAIGPDGKPRMFNTPSIYNSHFNVRQSWVGRRVDVDNLPAHAGFGDNWPAVAARVRGSERREGEIVDPDAADALGHYLRTLLTPSRFDRYLRGDAQALSADEKAGYGHFKRYGCVACHQGVNVGGNMFARLGAMRDYPGLALSIAGQGRFLHTGREEDRYVFRVPALRNVALTAPYLHDGSVATLDEMVELMFRYQLGRSAAPHDKAQIVQFLHTLTGEAIAPPGAVGGAVAGAVVGVAP